MIDEFLVQVSIHITSNISPSALESIAAFFEIDILFSRTFLRIESEVLPSRSRVDEAPIVCKNELFACLSSAA